MTDGSLYARGTVVIELESAAARRPRGVPLERGCPRGLESRTGRTGRKASAVPREPAGMSHLSPEGRRRTRDCPRERWSYRLRLQGRAAEILNCPLQVAHSLKFVILNFRATYSAYKSD